MNWRDVLDRLRAAVYPAEDALDVIEASERVSAGLGRRAFLRAALVGTAAAALVDVDNLLWTPGEKTILLPSVEPVRLFDAQTGISIRFIRSFDVHPAKSIHRIDLLVGNPWLIRSSLAVHV